MQHLAIIPDGNRRWAAKNKLETVFGHKRGMEVIKTVINVCIKNQIKYVSLYTFSIENFRRSETEKDYLFALLADSFLQELPELLKNGVQVRFVGDRSLFPQRLHNVVHEVESKTAHLTTLTMSLLFCYGGRMEIVQAVKLLAQQVKAGLLDVASITEETVRGALWAADVPDPDLIIRTGGAVRLSNFLLYQSAYSELTFLDCFWPEVTQQHLEKCIQDFDSVKRNFGS